MAWLSHADYSDIRSIFIRDTDEASSPLRFDSDFEKPSAPGVFSSFASCPGIYTINDDRIVEVTPEATAIQ